MHPRARMRILCLVVAVLAAVGCRRSVEVTSAPSSTPSSVSGGVTVSMDAASYAPGATVRLRIVNGTQHQLGYNACTRTIERNTGGNSWSPVTETGRMCTMHLALIQPRSERGDNTDLPAALAAGTYRLTLRFSPQAPTPSGQTAPIVASTGAFIVR